MKIEKDDEHVAFDRMKPGDILYVVLKIDDYRDLNLIRVVSPKFVSKIWGILDLIVVEGHGSDILCTSRNNPNLKVTITRTDQFFTSMKEARQYILTNEKPTDNFNRSFYENYFNNGNGKEDLKEFVDGLYTFMSDLANIVGGNEKRDD
jgi:hypothetical protein